MDRLLVGRTLGGRYEVREVLGRGGMSIVYRGFDHRLEREVAIKVIHHTGTSEQRDELRARFRREAGAAARIPHHPNVVQIYDYGTDPELDLDFIAMELLRGRDLKQALTAVSFTTGEAVRILSDAARGIAAGHRAGVVHRDVKPANILLPADDGHEHARVLDFGIAKLITGAEDLTVAGRAPYSPAYASPEQLAGDAEVTPASDVYQLGLIGYETLAGERPFTREDRDRAVAGAPIPLPSSGRWGAVPQPVRAVIERALDPDPRARYPDAGALADALDGAWQPDMDVPVSPPAAAPPPIAAARRRVGPVPLAIVAVLALFAFWTASRGMGSDPAGELEGLPAAEASAVPAGEEEPESAPGAVIARTPARDGAEARAAVMEAVADANRAWVEGDLERHIGHYARRVDYYNSKRLPRSGVLRDRRRDLNRYPEREIRIDRQEVEFPEPGRARVLADKSWRFGGGERERVGKGLQEYVLEHDDGRWRIVSEQLLEEFRSERRTGEDG